MSLPLNPYRTGEPVGHTECFVGRRDMVENVINILEDSKTNMILLYGQRRIGKTSILQYLEEHLTARGSYHTVYFDFHGKSDLPLSAILKELAYAIARKLKDLDDRYKLLWKPEETFREEWLPYILKGLPEQSSLVLLFDEFDVLADPQSGSIQKTFVPRLLDLLRDLSLVYREQLQFIFVIGRHKSDLSIVARSLFRDSSQYLVSLLDLEDVADLVRLSEQNRTLYWHESAIEEVVNLTNGHALLTQQLCSQIWELAYDREPESPPTVTKKMVAAAIPGVLEESSQYLISLWNTLSVTERVAAAILADAGSKPVTQEQLENMFLEKSQMRIVIREVEDAPQRLRDHDILELVDQERFRFRVELIRQWIERNRPLDIVQEEVDNIQKIVENLYQIASSLKQEGRLEQARDQARKAFDRNPYHIRTNQLLADILLEQHDIEGTRKILEWLYDYKPSAASSRLIKLYMLLVKKACDDDQRIDFYGRVLEINPTHREALKGWQEIWEMRARFAEKLAETSGDLEDLESAREAYEKADLQDKAEQVERRIHEQVIFIGSRELDELIKSGEYLEAFTLLNKWKQKYPDFTIWEEYRKRLTPEVELAKLYQKAMEALRKGNTEVARTLLIKIIRERPSYKDATLHLHQVVTNTDYSDLVQRLADAESRCKKMKDRIQELHDHNAQAQSEIELLRTTIGQLEYEVKKLNNELTQARAKAQYHEGKLHQHKAEAVRREEELRAETESTKDKFEDQILQIKKEAERCTRKAEEARAVKFREIVKRNERVTEKLNKYETKIHNLERDLEITRNMLKEARHNSRENRKKSNIYLASLTLVLIVFSLILFYTYVLR